MLNKYPLWKNLLLLAILLIAVIYAAPNLYGDDPAVQISPPTDTPVDAALISKVTTALKTAGLTYKAIEQDPREILIRFQDTDTELKAKDVLKAILSDDYTIAVNIAPATPAWLTALGAKPMKLGLDLRGGIHFALQVDINSVIAQRME